MLPVCLTFLRPPFLLVALSIPAGQIGYCINANCSPCVGDETQPAPRTVISRPLHLLRPLRNLSFRPNTIMKSSMLFLASLAAICSAAPTPTTQDTWSPELADFYSAVDRHIQLARDTPGYPNSPPSCNLQNAVMAVGPTPLPSPQAGSVLLEVAIGRGVQNYTCALASPSYTPVAQGALASLYNASCIAGNYPDILAILPPVALQFPLPPEPTGNLQPPNIDLTGHHYFATNTTPVFNLDANPDNELGIAVSKKIANSTAPATADKGVNGLGDGAVAWLYLQTTNASTGGITDVYRINTAGGNPPKTCESSPAVFSVQYSAEYWFWGRP